MLDALEFLLVSAFFLRKVHGHVTDKLIISVLYLIPNMCVRVAIFGYVLYLGRDYIHALSKRLYTDT